LFAYIVFKGVIFVIETLCVFPEVATIFLRDTYVKFRRHSVDG